MVFEVDAECRTCDGTGLYVGMAELRGAAVECNICKGSAKEKIKIVYTPFIRRYRHTDIRKVFKTNPGFGINPGTKGGMSFEDWFDGKVWPKRGHEIREYTCPAWYYQSEDNRRKPSYIWCGPSAGSMFSECPKFKDKEECWKRFDKEGK